MGHRSRKEVTAVTEKYVIELSSKEVNILANDCIPWDHDLVIHVMKKVFGQVKEQGHRLPIHIMPTRMYKEG